MSLLQLRRAHFHDFMLDVHSRLQKHRTASDALHVVSLVAMGMWLIDNGNLEELAQACARYRRWEFMLTLAPLVLERVTGSPTNPIALF